MPIRSSALGESRAKSVVLDDAVLSKMAATAAAVDFRSSLFWGEHCSECAMPSCYATCALYTPRQDLKCRRLEDGIELVTATDHDGRASRLLRVTFRPWAKILAEGHIALRRSGAASLFEWVFNTADKMWDVRWLPYRPRRFLGRVMTRLKQVFEGRFGSGIRGDGFLVEVFNPGATAVDVDLSIRDKRVTDKQFQEAIRCPAGYSKVLIPLHEIENFIDISGCLLIGIEPLPACEMSTLLFSTLDFVACPSGSGVERPDSAPTALAQGSHEVPRKPKVKCVVWDLDNTLWKGVLVEDGPDGLVLDPRMAAAIVELDSRGILNSIASKNNPDETERVLRKFGLWEYFLAPQIHWEPKSNSIAAIAAALNINQDTFVFVDDQPFERGEVAAGHPQVEVVDPRDLPALLASPRLDVPKTADAARRRQMYQQERARSSAMAADGTSFIEFLKQSGIRVTLTDLAAATLDRVSELAERTNQLNYSAEKMSRVELEKLLGHDGDVLGIVIQVEDKFGDYGVVGFAVVNRRSWTMENFFMSCRVQRKKIENALLYHLEQVGSRLGHERLSIFYRKSERNEPARRVLEDELSLPSVEAGTGRLFQLLHGVQPPDHAVVTIDDRSVLKDLVRGGADVE